MKLRTAVLPSLVAVALIAPPASTAATLSVNKNCYGPGEKIAFSGGGFTPNVPVALSVAGRQLGVGPANAVGEIDVSIGAPAIGGKRRTDFYTATDQTDLALTAGVPVHLTSLNVKVTPKNGNPGKAKRVVARGFTSGRTLYAHVRRGKSRRNVKVGRLKGACGTIDLERKLFPADAKDGVYTIQFDGKRKYSAKTTPQVSFVVTVFRTFSPFGSASSAGESWGRAD